MTRQWRSLPHVFRPTRILRQVLSLYSIGAVILINSAIVLFSFRAAVDHNPIFAKREGAEQARPSFPSRLRPGVGISPWTTERILKLLTSDRAILSEIDNLNSYCAASSLGGDTTQGPGQPPAAVVRHRVFYGLGHRLHRSAAAFDLAHRLGAEGLKAEWGDCPSAVGGGGDLGRVPIWDHLFGQGGVRVEGSRRSTGVSNLSTELLVTNEVPGYKPFSTRINRNGALSRDLTQSTADLYKLLRARFIRLHGWGRVSNFLRMTRWTDRVSVLGLHVRAGNGEVGNFKNKGRGFTSSGSDLDVIALWAEKTTVSLLALLSERGSNNGGNRPLIFVATDTESVVRMLQASFRNHTAGRGVDVVSLPQQRISPGLGVSYRLDDARCLDGWLDQIADMVLLSLADTVISARYSSFVQSMPLSLVFAEMEESNNTKGKHPYCELGLQGEVMSCYNSIQAWRGRSQSFNPGRISFTSEGRSDSVFVPQIGDSDDTLPYPLTEEECLHLNWSAGQYFANKNCLQAHVICKETPGC